MKHHFLNTPASLILFLVMAVMQLFSSCTSMDATENTLTTMQTGTWHVVLQAQGQENPFIMHAEEREGSTVLYFAKGEERILLDDIQP